MGKRLFYIFMCDREVRGVSSCFSPSTGLGTEFVVFHTFVKQVWCTDCVRNVLIRCHSHFNFLRAFWNFCRSLLFYPSSISGESGASSDRRNLNPKAIFPSPPSLFSTPSHFYFPQMSISRISTKERRGGKFLAPLNSTSCLLSTKRPFP